MPADSDAAKNANAHALAVGVGTHCSACLACKLHKLCHFSCVVDATTMVCQVSTITCAGLARTHVPGQQQGSARSVCGMCQVSSAAMPGQQ
jgi:hypothetical protein